MDMMTLTQLAQQTDLAPPTVRRYLDDYILYVPSVRVDGTVGFPGEAVEVIRTIHRLSETGHSHTEITSHLEGAYPVTVISAQPLNEGEGLPPLVPAIAGLLKDVDAQYRAVHAELDALRTDVGRAATESRLQQIQHMVTSSATTTFQHFEALAGVPADIAQIKGAIGVLATRIDRAATAAMQHHAALKADIAAMGAQVTATSSLPIAGLTALRAELSEIRQGLALQSDTTPGEAVETLRPEFDTLQSQIVEMRQERAQMLHLMVAMREEMAAMRTELSEVRHTPAAQPQQHQATGTTRNAPHLMAVPQPGPEPEAGPEPKPEPDKLRTPRRLGHITGR